MEDQKQLKLGLTVTQWVIIILGIVMAAVAMSNENPEDMDGVMALDKWTGGMMWIVYIAMGICTLAGVGFGILQFVKNLGKSKASLISLGAFAFLIILSYVLAGSETEGFAEGTTESESKMASALIIGMYIAGLGAILAAVFSAVKGILKK